MSEQRSTRRIGTCCLPYCDNHYKQPEFAELIPFPTSSERQLNWINILNVPDLEKLSPRTIEKKTICSTHFDSKYLVTLRGRPAVTFNAVPLGTPAHPLLKKRILREPLHSITNVVRYENTSPSKSPAKKKSKMGFGSVRRTLTYEDEPKSIVPEVQGSSANAEIKRDSYTQTLTERAYIFRKTVKRKRDLVSKLRKQITRLTTAAPNVRKILEVLQTKLPKHVYILIRPILTKGKRKNWDPDEKNLSVGIYFRNPAYYKLLRNDLGFNLPSPSTIKTWMSRFSMPEGFNESIGTFLKDKASNAKWKKQLDCALMFDEMSLKEKLCYDRGGDVLYGLDRDNSDENDKCVKHALMFMLKGLAFKWQIPISYAFSTNGVKGNHLKTKILETIEKVHQTGVNVRLITCDQGTNNQLAFKCLKITPSEPYFGLNGKRIYCMYDPPHLVKSLRNNLCKHDIVYDGHRISWKYIQKLYSLNTGRVYSMGKRLTYDMVYPNSFNKMKVKNATKLFSHTVASQLHTLASLGRMGDDAHRTADFISDINTLFDILNSHSLKVKDYFKQPISRRNEKKINAFLNSMKAKIAKWRIEIPKVNKKTKKPYKLLKILPCFKGLLVTINAYQMLWSDLRVSGYTHFKGHKTNQDALENRFSIIRQKGGWTLNPTAYQFAHSHRLSTLTNILKPPTTTSYFWTPENSYSDLVLAISQCASAKIHCYNTLSTVSFPDQSNRMYEPESVFRQQFDIVDLNAINYICGFVAKRYSKQRLCAECNFPFGEIASFTNCNGVLENVFTTHKDFKYFRTGGSEGLLYVSNKNLEKLIVKCAQVFRISFGKMKTESHIVCELIKTLLSLGILEETQASFCNEHIFRAIKLAFQLAITNYVRGFNDKRCDVSGNVEKFKKFMFK